MSTFWNKYKNNIKSITTFSQHVTKYYLLYLMVRLHNNDWKKKIKTEPTASMTLLGKPPVRCSIPRLNAASGHPRR